MKNVAIAFAALSLLASGGALAQVGPVQMTVVTHDLDLRSNGGKAKLQRRLEIAAAEVCGDASASDPAGRRAIRTCRNEVVAAALQELVARQSASRLAQR